MAMRLRWHMAIPRAGLVLRISALTVALLSTVGIGGQATNPAQSHLGRVDFPTSCSAEAQPLLDKALALLHSFQYMEARQTFEQAQAADSKCAMAHWGKAMSLYEQLWMFPMRNSFRKVTKKSSGQKRCILTLPKNKGFSPQLRPSTRATPN
jgi:Tfp pilus assembly protein PilF